MSFQKRLLKIEQIEDEILRRASRLMQEGGNIYVSDLFVLGAVKRVLALASGFRTLMAERNFTCCAGLLRMQIDTAARVNALKFVDSMDALCQAVLSGKRFDKQKDRDGQFLRDNALISKLAADFPWVGDVYKETSGFVHLSERHMFTSMVNSDDTSRKIQFFIGAKEPERPDEAYFEILDCFFEATEMTGSIILGYVEYRSKMDAQA
ncbi:hypothetical protein HB777_06055 [Mesorhizobium loti]|nr:hypothetical protein HB777_06055 [Mesorhizobium loti]